MNPSLARLIAESAGSQLVGYSFEDQVLRFQLLHGAGGRLLAFVVPTDTVHGRTVSADARRTTCRIELVDLRATLDVFEGRYAPPTDPTRFLDQARRRHSLAYGRRTSELGWSLTLIGDYPLLSCLVRDPAEIRWADD